MSSSKLSPETLVKYVVADRGNASEAINSMYRWYQQAEVCFAYLSDVPPYRGPVPDLKAFRKARWFTRGWCLQELIAPRELEFFAEDWTEIGTKDSLRPVITQVTGIPEDVLSDSKSAYYRSAAERMSWASKRQTSREEDVAYCLFGLFDVNLPLLYGEGGIKAFLRLQEEILKRTLDLSLLLWCYNWKPRLPSSVPIGALCGHPHYFAPEDLRTISGATFLYSELPRVLQSYNIGYIDGFEPPQIVGNYLKLSLMTIPSPVLEEEGRGETRLASIARLGSQFGSPQHICILLVGLQSRVPFLARRIRNSALELQPEASFTQETGGKVEEIHLRLYEDVPSESLGGMAKRILSRGSTLQLHISARCKVPYDELVVTEALASAMDAGGRRHRMVAYPLDRGNDSFRQDNMILLNASTPLSLGFTDRKVAIRFLVRSRATSSIKIAAALVLYPSGPFLQRHWALRSWEAERPLDEANFEPFILDPEAGLNAGIVLDTSDRTMIWISSLGQCLEISRRRRLDKYFLELVLSRCDWAGPYPEGAQELCLTPSFVRNPGVPADLDI